MTVLASSTWDQFTGWLSQISAAFRGFFGRVESNMISSSFATQGVEMGLGIWVVGGITQAQTLTDVWLRTDILNGEYIKTH